MTETPYAPPPLNQPPPTPAPPSPALRRRRDDRVLGGICSGVARSLGVDPVLVRVVVVVLVLFGGGGILAYLAAWLFIPEDGRDQSAAQRALGVGSSQLTLMVIIAIVVLLGVASSASGVWFGLGPDFGAPGVLLLIGTIVLVVWLVRRGERPTEPKPGQPPAVLPTSDVPALPPLPEPRAPRSTLGLLTVSAAAVVSGSLIVVGLTVQNSAINATAVFAAALTVVGIGLGVGTFVGRSRGLIVLGVGLVLATAVSAAVHSVDLSGGFGERTWRPLTAAEAEEDFHVGLGEATLDLRRLAIPAGGLIAPITASVGAGELIVYLPADANVEITASVGLGEINVVGQPPVNGSENDLTTVIDSPSATETIAVDLEVGMGQVTVRQLPTPSPIPIPPGAPR